MESINSHKFFKYNEFTVHILTNQKINKLNLTTVTGVRLILSDFSIGDGMVVISRNSFTQRKVFKMKFSLKTLLTKSLDTVNVKYFSIPIVLFK